MASTRMKRWRAAAIALAIGSVGGLRAAPVDLDRDAVVAGLQRWLDGTRDLQCTFEQSLDSGALGPAARESGVLYLRRPGRMRWDYQRPEAKIALLDDGATLVYLPEDRQLLRGKLPEEGGSIVALLAGGGRITEHFSAFLVATPRAGGRGLYHLRLVPRAQGEGFEEVTLTLRPPDLYIESAEVVDPAGNRLTYRFDRMRRNRGVPDTLFRFEPPPGTQIVETD